MNPYISDIESNNLFRDVYTMPTFIIDALKKNNLEDKYLSRPAYQKNDYVGWITRAKREETKQKRLKQMLEELKRGDSYMNMSWSDNKSLKLG